MLQSPMKAVTTVADRCPEHQHWEAACCRHNQPMLIKNEVSSYGTVKMALNPKYCLVPRPCRTPPGNKGTVQEKELCV